MPEPSSNTDLPQADTDGATTWCSIADVLAITGETVTDADIQRAQFVIDIVSGRSIETSQLLANYLHKRDLYRLRLATAYQTVWMLAQPDMFTRIDVTDVKPERGLESMFVPGALTLAPMAKRCIRALSWKGTRSQQIGRRCSLTLNDYMNPNAPIRDYEGEQFSPLGSIGDADAFRDPVGPLEF